MHERCDELLLRDGSRSKQAHHRVLPPSPLQPSATSECRPLQSTRSGRTKGGTTSLALHSNTSARGELQCDRSSHRARRHILRSWLPVGLGYHPSRTDTVHITCFAAERIPLSYQYNIKLRELSADHLALTMATSITDEKRRELPSQATLDEVGEINIKDKDGKEVPLKSLYTGKPANERQLIIFVRHFFCGVSCRPVPRRGLHQHISSHVNNTSKRSPKTCHQPSCPL